MTQKKVIDRPASPLSGRDDGEGSQHQRWFKQLQPLVAADLALPQGLDSAVIGFACDEGVRRNQGRVGAHEAPPAIRAALANLALSREQSQLAVADLGDIVVDDQDLEAGQERLAHAVAQVIDAGALAVVLGGGHEVAFATYSGLASSKLRQKKRIGILNLDAHFDLRHSDTPSSGTPFLQALETEKNAGTELSYAVVGISQPSNTHALFDAADEFAVTYLLDEECQESNQTDVARFIEDFISSVDLLYLTVDLDVLPASVAPGVSAPAGFGVPLSIILQCVQTAAASGKLCAADIAELNPRFDIDGRTARTAARIAHTILTHHRKLNHD